MSASILVVEDDLTLLELIQGALQDEGYYVVSTGSGKDARRAFAIEFFDVCLLDVHLPDANGLDLLAGFRAQRPGCVYVMMTADADVQTAVQSMRNGAYDFVEKPFRIERFCTTVRKAADHASGRETVRRMVQQAVQAEEFIGSSAKIRALLNEADQIARAGTGTAVLIQGETGTGKELIAKRIHAKGPGADAPFFAQSCANFTSTLLEDQLFGHAKGAFTEAHSEQRGLLSLASNGSLFLDEIGEMSVFLQPKILRVIESRKFRRLGDHREEQLDARIIAATNRDLMKMMSSGEFRQDLYYRLAIGILRIPPLRERPEDIPGLLDYYLSYCNTKFNRQVERFTPEAAELLYRYSWPGNVRELRNLLERLAITWSGGSVIDVGHIQPTLNGGYLPGLAAPSPIGEAPAKDEEAKPRMVTLKEIADEHIVSIYSHTGGNKAETARILGISRQTVQKRLADLDHDGRLPILV